MTTEAAEAMYAAQHMLEHAGRKVALFNPHNKPIAELPVIYGFNNGGPHGWMSAVLLAQDGHLLGSHCCSAECYMPHDLGVLEGTRPDRHEEFKKHYPDGYRMEFVGADQVKTHPGLLAAYERHKQTPETPVAACNAEGENVNNMKWQAPSGAQYATRLDAVANGEQSVTSICAACEEGCAVAEARGAHYRCEGGCAYNEDKSS